MKKATRRDIPAVERFLKSRAASSMYPLTNLARYGSAGGHPRAMSFWIGGETGAIRDVLAVSDEGMVFPQCPTGPWQAVAEILRGVGPRGLVGAADQVMQARVVTGLTGVAPLDLLEPHYQLTLSDLRFDDAGGDELVPLSDVPRPLLNQWRAAFCEEVMNFPPAEARARAIGDILVYLDQDSHRVLLRSGRPVAMTGFNAILPDIVQVGGVYTPPDLRGRGHARVALALHLQQARATGVRQAVLSAATPAAARAYEAIGFRRIGDFAMAIWPDRQALYG